MLNPRETCTSDTNRPNKPRYRPGLVFICLLSSLCARVAIRTTSPWSETNCHSCHIKRAAAEEGWRRRRNPISITAFL